MAFNRRDLLRVGSAAIASIALPGFLKQAGAATAPSPVYGGADSPELDLREFLPQGFVTNGSVDYSSEMQSCISAGKRIFIPAGVWLCDNINVRGYRNIRGAGRANTVLKALTGSSSFLLSCTDGNTNEWLPYASISDIAIDGSRGSSLGAIYAEYITNWIFQRITIYDFHNRSAVGLWLDHAYQIMIRDCYARLGSRSFGKKGSACFKISATTADPIHTTHITFDNCLAQYSDTGFLLASLGKGAAT